MAINRISGNILADNLERGAALAFQTDLLYLDVISGNVGINTASATHTLTVNGNCNILGPTEISGNVTGGNILTAGSMSATGNVTANVGNFTNINVGNIDIGNLIGGGNLTVDSVTANLFLSAIGNVVGNILIGNTVSAVGNVTGGNITTPGDISAGGNITANNFSGTGNISLGNLSFSNTTITTTLATGNITLLPTGNSTVIIDTVSGMVLPVGNTVERPSPVSTGTVRFNTDSTRIEVYDGSGWEDIAANVTNQTLAGNGVQTVFTLDRDSTTAATLVIINGIVQLPSTAYAITGNSLTFAQAPTISDIIDIRFL